jgi:hypothetical protein
MELNPRTLMAAFIVLWLVCAAIAMAIWWTRRRYPGFGRWLIADLTLFLSLCLLSLRPAAPDWVSIVSANAVLVFGRRTSVGLPRWASSRTSSTLFQT